MSKRVADLLVDVLLEAGVQRVYGVSGDSLNGITDSIRTHNEIEWIHVRHEEAAAFMACGYAKHTGRLGACIATTGPGAIHLMNGLYDAKMDSAPVIAITGLTFMISSTRDSSRT